ncbi:transcriptional regulator, ArsR family [Pyrobaculum neutrophilum V24Sta]|uniref:Transcriptional regulator, ArsR family n=1 Tax=Pyrobaculum neutrophilum (strain DSM 2338 / JCM 9278 / NBRC 100436 / V24Sta) TaxID=444157 RepID=B1YDZ5_PYRNV|nr:transcriptional regulator, ArsR family [Pyrobaculum neutrophilum V24Sta]
MRIVEVEAEDAVLAEALRRHGVEVRRGAPVVAVYGRDRDILRALRSEERPVLGVSPPGVDARLAALELREVPLLPDLALEVVDVVRVEAESGGQRVVAINEVALLAAEPASFVRYSLYVDGAFVFNDLGDGCLVSTPVGSTAYALSAGGAVVSPRADVLEVVPVNSALRRPPHVFPSDVRIELRDVRSRSDVYLIGDGAEKIRYRGYAAVAKAGTAKLVVRPQRPRAAPRLPPSVQLVKRVVEERGPLTASEVAALTGLSPRTVRYALEKLREAGLVRSTVDPTDPRRRIYMA